MSSKFQNDAIFWVEVEKIKPNPYQPRRDFNEERLRDLAESIRQYGVLQPLTVTRREHVKEDGGLKVQYELIAGERRHRASQLANLSQVPVIIRSGDESSQVKLELAIIENLQREDLNPIERAEAFDQLVQEFEFTHKQVAEKIGKSREYVSNSMRLLKLPEDIKMAIINGQMTEGHARPIMMLRDKPEQQETLFKEVVHKGLTVREAESIARRDAQDKVRKKKNKVNPQTKQLEDRLSDTFGTRVKIEERDVGGKLVIDFFSEEDLENIIKLVQAGGDMEVGDMMEQYVERISEEDDSSEESEQNEEASEGKSMADTLSTMIAAARKQHAAKQEQETPAEEQQQATQSESTESTSSVREAEYEEVSDISDHQSGDFEDTASVATDQSDTVNDLVSNDQVDEDASPESDNLEVSDMVSESPQQPGGENETAEVADTTDDSWSAQEQEAESNYSEEDEPVAEVEQKMNEESSFAKVSADKGGDTNEQEGKADADETDEEEAPNQSLDEHGSGQAEEEDSKDEDEIYAVSNFSI